MKKKDFFWGVATASVQIEGGAYQDGKSPTVWDVMAEDGGFVRHSHQVTNSDNSYNMMDEDIALMKELGINAYRFSLSWARIIKNGDGEINEKGLEHYSIFVDKLLKAGIEPFITLFHWDLPYGIYLKGGWLNRNIAKDFKRYVEVVAGKLADRVKYFITINEPQCIMSGTGGVIGGAHYSVKEKNTMVHNLLLCHGEAVKVLRKYKNVKIGFAPCGDARMPLTNSKEDIEAARLAYFDYSRGDTSSISLYSDPIVLGDYPKKYYEVNKKEEIADILPGDMQLISQPIDFYCQNIYSGVYIKSDGKDGYIMMPPPQNTVYTVCGWVVTPEALYWGPKFLYERYKLPFVMSENGTAVTDIITEDKKVHDSSRCEYLNQYIKQYLRAGDDGVDIRGYFVWSLLDNFEWYEGYTKRFGLVYVDYDNYNRYPKDSFYFYQDLIKKEKE